jgi:hypothetical protein
LRTYKWVPVEFNARAKRNGVYDLAGPYVYYRHSTGLGGIEITPQVHNVQSCTIRTKGKLPIGLNFLTSTSASGSNPLAVTVTNTPLAVKAPNGNSTPLPVSVNNVPNVNIASVPAVTLASGTSVGLASGTGVTVTNPLDNSGKPRPVHTRSGDDAGRTPVGALLLDRNNPD